MRAFAFLVPAVAVLAVGFAPVGAADEPPSNKEITTSANNLKQIGLAHHAYHDVNGTMAQDIVDKNGKPLLSWRVHLLPYIEQDNLYKNTNHTTVRRTPVKTYFCPSRRAPIAYGNEAKGDYAANSGNSTGANNNTGTIERTGLVTLRLADITDGTSNTAMVGEKRMKLDKFNTSYDDNESYYSAGWDSETIRAAVTDADDANLPAARRTWGPSRDIRVTDPALFSDVNSGLSQFGSSHASGCNFALADGSVRHVRFNPDRTQFRRFCVRNDGAVLNFDY